MTQLFGWHPNARWTEEIVATLPHPVFGLAADHLKDSGKGKVVLLHKSVEKVTKKPFPVNHQTIGDCVSHGWALGVDVLKCVQIDLEQQPQEWNNLTATEVIYAGSRVEIGGGRLGNGDGSLGAWAAKWVTEYGVIARGVYGSIDLSTYDGNRAKKWGARGAGVPDDLEPIAKQFPVRTVSLVTTYEQARDSIANGYPVPVCSMQGFSSTRDSEGFAKPQGQWAHCMLFMAVDDSHRRPGLLCMNSWGPNWISGPTRHDQPPGSFWVDADVCNRMLRGQDSFAISNFAGYPARKPNFFFG